MPTRQKSTYAPVTSSQPGVGQIAVALSSFEYSQVTDTTPRTRPQDLFANGTARAGQERVETYGTASAKDGAGHSVTGPASYWMSVGAIGTAPDPSNDLTSRLRAEIKSQNMNLGQMFAEGRQSIGLLVDLATDAIKAYRSLRKEGMASVTKLITYDPRRDPGAQKWFTKAQKALANRWLQYQWGVKPLVQDLYDVTNSYMSGVKLGAYRYAQTSCTTNDSFYEHFKLGGWSNVWVERWTHYNVGKRAKARYLVSAPEIKTLAESGGLNLPSVLWEITPYSFVFDSLINIGEVLDSLDALAGVSDLKYFITTETKSQSGMTLGGAYCEQRVRYFTRTGTLTNLPMPKLAFKQSGKLTKALNLVALLRQLR